jgi:[acyl-carrier-protein] S-malonyltransferase
MEPARKAMEPILGALGFRPPVCPLVNNVDAQPVTDAETLRSGLIRQISGAVRWEDTMKFLLGQGVTSFIELGPGKVLSGIASRMAKDAGAEVRSVSIGNPGDEF